MCVKKTVMVVAAAFVVVHVQKRRLEKGKHQGQVHQDSSGKPHIHIVQSRQTRTPSQWFPFERNVHSSAGSLSFTAAANDWQASWLQVARKRRICNSIMLWM